MLLVTHLLLDHVDIIERDPLISIVSIGTNSAFRILDDLPALLDLAADLIVSQEPCLLCELALIALVSLLQNFSLRH